MARALDLGDRRRRRGRHAGRAAVRGRRGTGGEVGRVHAGVGAAGCALVGQRGADPRRRSGALEVVGRAIADEVDDGGRGVAVHPARQGGLAADQRDLAAGGRHRDAAGGVRCRQRGTDRCRRRLLDQVGRTGRDLATQVRDLPRGAGRRRVLDGVLGDVDRRGADVLDLDEVVREGRATVASTAVHLVDDEGGRRGGRVGGVDREGHESRDDGGGCEGGEGAPGS